MVLAASARVALLGLVLASCGERDADTDARARWIGEQTAAHKLWVRQALNGSDEVAFEDGWYNLENDPKAGGAWRWMTGRGVLRLRTKLGDAPAPVDMQLVVFGWIPHENIGFRSQHMTFAANGHVLEEFDPPPESFEHAVEVPAALLSGGKYIDFVITVTNTTRPNGDWRDLGFATTGFHWKPKPAS